MYKDIWCDPASKHKDSIVSIAVVSYSEMANPTNTICVD